MTWEDDLLRQEERLREIENEIEDGLRLTERNLEQMEKALSALEKKRVHIGEKEYSSNKTTLLQTRQQTYDLRQRFLAKKADLPIARQELDRAWMKCEELRYKGIRG